MTYDRRLIEDSLPLEVISAQSAREKSIRHGHISTLHIWWARRPLAAMRAAIFASLIPAPKDEAERAYLHKLIEDIVNWDSVKNGNNARVEEARALIRKHYPDAPPKVLDPFMGGGSTGLEALRLGAEAYGVELNPVAYLIQLCTLVYPQKYGQPRVVSHEEKHETVTLPPVREGGDPKQVKMFSSVTRTITNPLAADVHRWGLWVLEEARKEIGHLYDDPDGRTIVAYLWARTAKCPNPQCGAEMPMVRQLWLSKSDRKKVAIRMKVIEATKTIEFEVAEGSDIDFDPDQGTMRDGSIVCPVCRQTPSDNYLMDEGKAGRLGMSLMAIVTEGSESGRTYRGADKRDFEQFKVAAKLLSDFLGLHPELEFLEQIEPTRPSPNARGLSGLTRYGINTFGQLFNPRQMLVLLTFSRIIQETIVKIRLEHEEDYARAVATYLALALDKLADYNSVVTTWNVSRDGIRNTFTRQAIPMVWDYAESNPFGNSSGNWIDTVSWVADVLAKCTLAASNSAALHRGNATRLSQIEDAYLDAVVTDPPYYDSVPYSDLSDFFYVILKRSIGNLYPELLSSPLTPKTAEIVEHARHGAGAKNFYEQQMTLAFSEASRVVRDNGILVVVFAHTSTAAWETLINSLLNAKLVITASWPLNTERSSRLVAVGNAALASSIFIVCRKRQANDDGSYDDVRHEMTARIKERLDFFWSQGIRGADFFISAIGPAVEVFGRYRAVRKLSGEVISVATLLDLVQEAVADYTLSRVLNGRYQMGTVDAPTRFYVMYRWSHGGEKLLFDDARRLAQALGAEVSELIHYGVLKQSGDSVAMPSASERKKQEHLGEAGRDGAAPSVIDVLHRAVLVWQEGDRRALAEYLAQNALGREEEVNAVAQALVNVLPQGDRERQMLENYLQGSNDLPDVLSQGRLL